MILTEEQRKELEAVSRPLVQWLNDNCHPHVKVITDCSRVQLLEGVAQVIIEDYIKD